MEPSLSSSPIVSTAYVDAFYDATSPEEIKKVKEEKAAKGKEKRKVKKEAKERAAKVVKTK